MVKLPMGLLDVPYIGMKPQHHSLRSVPGGRWLFVTLPLVGDSDGAEIETVEADGRDGPEEGAWEGAQERDLGCLAEGTTREVVCVGHDVEVVVGFLQTQCYNISS